MRKNLLTIIMLIFYSGMMAQNFQFHYDFNQARDGKDSKKGFVTTTVEMFRPDPHGSTFFFIDMNYNALKGGVSLAYWEIARDIKLAPKFPLQAHVEYNGGLLNNRGSLVSIPSAWLFGASYPFTLCKGNFSTYMAYKTIAGNTGGDFQWTGTWFYPFAKGKLSASGFIDVWTDEKQTKENKVVLLAEPQFWFNTGHRFSFGTEIEISKNFYDWMPGIKVFPTAAIKVSFEK